MVERLLNGFALQVSLLAIIYVLILVVIALDLWSGVRKAKQRGEYRSSYGYRKTVQKVANYFNAIFVLTIIDFVQMLAVWQLNEQTNYSLPLMPFLTFLGAIFIGFIEFKSIYEAYDKKEQARIEEVAKLVQGLIKDKENQDVAGAVINYIKSDKKQNI